MMAEHEHQWERGAHITEAFGVDGRRYHCAICGEPKPSFMSTKVMTIQPEVELTSIRDEVHVQVRKKRRDGDDLTHDAVLPAGWPVPEIGSVVMAGPLAGWVEHTEYDIDAARIVIILRP